MDPDFERRWRLARALENAGDAKAAKEAYEALLAEDPHRLYVRLRLLVIEQAAGNYRNALRHAIACAEDVRHARWKDMAVVTRHLLAFDERELVRELIMGADWRHPEVLRDSPVLSQHLWLVGEVAESLRLIEAAMPFAEDNEPLRYSRANALRYMGRMDEASVEYEHCVRLAPNEGYAHWSLAFHEKSRPTGARVARIRKAIEANPAGSVQQPYLRYALFKELDDAGDVESAWEQLMAGAAAKRKQIRYQPEVEAEGFDALQRAIGAEPMGEADTTEGHVPIFIVGMPRSGTTLLERILGGHSQVSAAGELNDFQSVLSWESDRFIGRYPTPETVARLQEADHRAIGKHYLDRTRTWAKGCRYLVDKNPENFIHAGFIARALPQARIICLRRNPMDACFSNLKNLFSNDAYGYSYALEELADYYIRFDRLSLHWREMLGDQYLELEYEALVGEPMAMAERVMGFCGLPFEQDVVDITRNTSPVTTASSSQVRQPIHARGIGAWRRYAERLGPLRSRLETAMHGVGKSGTEDGHVHAAD